MAYVDIPKDLDGIKSKIMLGLTKKQLIGFGVAAVIGVPVYLATRVAIGNDFGLIAMMVSMALPLLYAIYEPKGMSIEQYLMVWLRFHYVSIGPRPYKNVNLYDILTESEVTNSDEQRESAISKTARRKKRSADRRFA